MDIALQNTNSHRAQTARGDVGHLIQFPDVTSNFILLWSILIKDLVCFNYDHHKSCNILYDSKVLLQFKIIVGPYTLQIETP